MERSEKTRSYLKGKIFLRKNEYRPAANELARVQFSSAFMNSRKEQFLGEAYFLLKEYQRARGPLEAIGAREEDW